MRWCRSWKHLFNCLSVLVCLGLLVSPMRSHGKDLPHRSFRIVMQKFRQWLPGGQALSNGYPRFEIQETAASTIQGRPSLDRLISGYYQASENSPQIYFEYRLPPNYSGVDLIEISGLSKSSGFWKGPNEQAEFLKNGNGILTFDGRVRGKTLQAISMDEEIPSVVTTAEEARLLKQLVESLGVNRAVVIGHSRGAGIGAGLSKLLLRENSARSKRPIQLLAHYDLNGLVSYVTQTFPSRTGGSDGNPNDGLVFENIRKLMEDGSVQDFKIRSPKVYYEELLSEWTQFEKEFLEQPEKYNETFVSDSPNSRDKWDTSSKEISETLYQELKLKFPLLVQEYSYSQESDERNMVDYVSDKSLTHGTKPARRDQESIGAMMRGLRTVFHVNHGGYRRKHFISHSVIPDLMEVAKAGVPIKMVFALDDLMVPKHHVAVKRSLFEGFSNVEMIRDESGSENGYTSHFVPNRSLWRRLLAKVIRAHSPGLICIRAQR